MAHQNLLCLVKRCSDVRGDEMVFRHNACNLHIIVGHKTHIAVCEYAYKLAAVVTDGNTRNSVTVHKLVRFLYRVLRMQEKRIYYNSVLTSLNLVHLTLLSLNGHILVNYAYAALTRYGYCHSRFGYGVHGRR